MRMSIATLCARAGFLIATSIGTTSCASAYRMPPETLAFRQTLDDTRALAIVNDLVRPHDGEADGMYAALLPERAVVLSPRVEGAHIAFDTIGPQISTSSQPQRNCRAPTGELVAVARQVPTLCTLTVDLRSLVSLGVSSTAGDASEASVARPRAPGYVVYARQSLTTGMYINVAPKDLGPLLAALTYLSPAAQVLQGGSISRPGKASPVPRLPSHVAVVSRFGVRLVALDGNPPAPCDHCDLTLEPGAHQFRVQYWETGFLDLGTEVTLLPGGTALAGPALSKEPVLLVRSRGARDLTATLLPGHTYGLLAGTNMALDDWFVSLFDETTQGTVVSDRAAHCKECGPSE